MLKRTIERLFGATVFVIAVCGLSPQAVRAAERCPVVVESIEEDRAMARSRPIWTARLFSISMLANIIVPGPIRIRAYTLGHVFQGQVGRVRWFPTEAASIFRSAPVVLAFPDDELLLDLGVSGLGALRPAYEESRGAECIIRLRTAYSSVPNMSLAPLNRRGAVVMQPLQPLRSRHAGCPEKSVRIARHQSFPIQSAAGAPVNGGPYVSLIGVRVSPQGSIKKTYIEVSSGLPWFDAEVREGARRQIYSPATLHCRPVAGTYYFSGQFATGDESDLRRAF